MRRVGQIGPWPGVPKEGTLHVGGFGSGGPPEAKCFSLYIQGIESKTHEKRMFESIKQRQTDLCGYFHQDMGCKTPKM